MIGNRRKITRGGNPYALGFDGDNDYVRCGKIFPSDDMSVSGWLETSNIRHDGCLFGAGSGNSDEFLFYTATTYGSASNQIRIIATGGEVIVGPDIRNTGWRHVCVTRDGSLFTLYIDGIQTKTGTQSGSFSQAFEIGNGSYVSRLLKASADDITLYNRALMTNEVKLLSKGVPISKKGLVGHWNFNEGQGDIAHDISGNGNNGTLVGNPTWTTDTPL